LDNILKSEEIKLKLHNYTEDLVIDKLKELLEQEENDNICKCDKCILDMCTFALNRLSPQYVVSHKGEVFTKINDFNQQSKVDVMATVAKAIEVVSKNPHEEKTD